jgi:hypothetical protein
MGLDNFLKEINPKYDFDDINFYRFNPDKINHFEDYTEFQYKNLFFVPNLIKPFGRGGILFGSVGAFSSYIFGGSYEEGYIIGVKLGVFLDVSQFYLRAMNNFVRAQIDK